jgi:hypothetical protein
MYQSRIVPQFARSFLRLVDVTEVESYINKQIVCKLSLGIPARRQTELIDDGHAMLHEMCKLVQECTLNLYHIVTIVLD